MTACISDVPFDRTSCSTSFQRSHLFLKHIWSAGAWQYFYIIKNSFKNTHFTSYRVFNLKVDIFKHRLQGEIFGQILSHWRFEIPIMLNIIVFVFMEQILNNSSHTSNIKQHTKDTKFEKNCTKPNLNYLFFQLEEVSICSNPDFILI